MIVRVRMLVEFHISELDTVPALSVDDTVEAVMSELGGLVEIIEWRTEPVGTDEEESE